MSFHNRNQTFRFRFILVGSVLLGLLFYTRAFAVPAPLPLPQLCQESDLIILGKYVGGSVTKPQGCEFYVHFQVKPEKIFKQPKDSVTPPLIHYQTQYYLDNEKCARIPGPVGNPDSIAAEMKKPTDQKKVFFFKGKKGEYRSLTNVFWSIVGWDQAPKEWHQEFKTIPACQGEEK